MAHLRALSSTARAFKPVVAIPSTGLLLGRNVPGPGALRAPSTWYQGKWLLRDLSRNGTFVNDKRIVKEFDEELQGGEKIKISVPLDASNDATLVEWEFVKSPIPASPGSSAAGHKPMGANTADPKTSEIPAAQPAVALTSTVAVSRGAAKRRAEASPQAGSAKRPKSSDGANWALQQNAKLRRQLQAQQEEHAKELASIRQRASEEKAKLQEELAAQQQGGKLAALEETERLLREREQEVESLKSSLQEVKGTVQELEISLQTRKQKFESLKEAVKELEAAQAALQGKLEEALKTIEMNKSESTRAKAEIQSLQAQLEDASQAKSEAQREVRLLANNLEARECILGEMQELVGNLQQAADSNRARDQEAEALRAQEQTAREGLLRLEEERRQSAAVSATDVQSLRGKLAFAVGDDRDIMDLGAATAPNATDASGDETGADEAMEEDASPDMDARGDQTELAVPETANNVDACQTAVRQETQAALSSPDSPGHSGDPFKATTVAAAEKEAASQARIDGACSPEAGGIPPPGAQPQPSGDDGIIQDSEESGKEEDGRQPGPNENQPPRNSQPSLTPRRPVLSPSKSLLSPIPRRMRSQN